MKDIDPKLKEVIKDIFCVNENEIVYSAKLREDLGADSLDIANLVLQCEKEFHIRVSDDHIDHIKTVGQLMDYVEDIMNKPPVLVSI